MYRSRVSHKRLHCCKSLTVTEFLKNLEWKLLPECLRSRPQGPYMLFVVIYEMDISIVLKLVKFSEQDTSRLLHEMSSQRDTNRPSVYETSAFFSFPTQPQICYPQYFILSYRYFHRPVCGQDVGEGSDLPGFASCSPRTYL